MSESKFIRINASDMRSNNPPIFHGESSRLTYSHFQDTDQSRFAFLTSHPDVQKTDVCFYGQLDTKKASEFINHYKNLLNDQHGYFFGMRLKPDNELIGSISLLVNPQFKRAELGFWVGRPYWSEGYATEAAEAIMTFGFFDLDLQRIHAQHLGNNPASGKVMQKLGMKYEGCLRQHVSREDNWFDMHQYGLQKAEYLSLADEKLKQLQYQLI